MKRLLVLLVLFAPAAARADVSRIIYLNRCLGGCIVYGGVDDARAMTSSIPCGGGANCGGGGCTCSGTSAGTYTISEFQNWQGQTGTAADEEWGRIVQCVREAYSPFNVTVTDVKPDSAISHTQGIIAGRPVDIGYGGLGLGGIAAGNLGCGGQDNVISFTFANIYTANNELDHVLEICSTASQETGHSFGLDHAYVFSDGSSACSDPMSYRSDCGGQDFFRNYSAKCGEYAARPCSCGGFQNSHQKLLSLFGPGTPLTTPPVVTVSAPTDGAMIPSGTPVIATASAQRGIARLELWLNNYLWFTQKGAAFGPTGQPETTYSLPIPTTVPDSIIDIQVKAFDDINVETDAPVITVTKGAPCTSADTCAKGQKCDAGKCYWDTPTGEFGDPCTYPQFCTTGTCLDTSAGSYCSTTCVVGVTDSCPANATCQGNPGESGFCVIEGAGDDTCCGIGANGKSSALLSLLVVVVTLRRRRR